MTPRSIRRAAERKALKLARKAAQNATQVNQSAFENNAVEEVSIQESPIMPEPITPAAANAQISAVNSAVTGQPTLLPTADAAPYTQLLLAYQNEYQAAGLYETELVQSLAEDTWRRRRCLALEMAIYAKGRIEFAAQFAEHKPEIRASMIELHTFLTYEKQIRGLQSQEARLARRIEKAVKELRELTMERRIQEERRIAKGLISKAQPAENGFVFANRETVQHPAQTPASENYFTVAASAETQREAA